ncbi:extracellular serine protease, partial [Serratia marcescens]
PAPRCTAGTGRRRTATTTTWRRTATSSSGRWRCAAGRATPGTASTPSGR